MTADRQKYQHSLSYMWHWWINSLPKDGPAGNPHDRHLYTFKSALEALPYFESYLRRAFEGTLPQQHQQCSHQAPEPLPEKNAVCCALGCNVTECPILLSLRDKFNADRSGHYAKEVPAEAVYELMARTCAWHMLAAEMIDGHWIDWNEGAMQDVSDRMFWRRTYDSLAGGPVESDEEPTPNT